MEIERRQFLKTAGAGACLAALKLPSVSADPGSAMPNIVLCMADDQGWGDMGYNGHPVLQTPNFDEMASSALRFDRFYAAAPVCSPTRGSVMTGRHPNRFGCFKWGHTLRPQEITIAEALKTAGYVTGHYGNVRMELYNLAEDPQEKNDLASRRSDRIQSMKSALEEWQLSVVRSLNGEDY